MALDATLATAYTEQGETTLRPSFLHRFTIPGDAAYATGGSLFQAVMRTVVAQKVTVNSVTGYGLTAGDITHFIRYDAATDKLLCYVLAGTEVPDATDLSAVTLDLAVISE